MQRNLLPGSQLAPPPMLSTLTRERSVALFLDFDGTLVDIAQGPDAIMVPEGLRDNLLQLDAALEGRLALVSGRSLADLERHIGSVPIARAGSHGAECVLGDGSVIGEPPAPVPEALKAELAELQEKHSGLEIEHKSFGIGMHYRAAPDLEGTIVEMGRCLASSYGMSIKQGKCVVELMTAETDKGRAVRSFMGIEQFAGAMPVFVGDDITDEDGFAASEEFDGFGIAVGEREPKLARYHLASTDAVRSWMHL